MLASVLKRAGASVLEPPGSSRASQACFVERRDAIPHLSLLTLHFLVADGTKLATIRTVGIGRQTKQGK